MSRPIPPPLPPRNASVASSVSSVSSSEGFGQRRQRVNTTHLTPHTAYPKSFSAQNHPYGGATGLDDPRSDSLQSLVPIESAGPNRRKLLLVFIHGFMGNETSFRSFPAHVHNILTMNLAESHVLHTKIYPRYQSRKNISYARDDFSNWLTPHESEDTDVILIGHSLGGILASEVVLLPSHRPGSKDLFQHRILGHIAYDTPFLGMHPGVVTTGIASLFKSAPDIQDAPIAGQDSSAGLSINPFGDSASDSNYNPMYDNDVNLPVRKGKMDRAFYFLNKHYGNWQKATTSYMKSHLEFGGCMADYDGLKKRYKSFRPLEDVDDMIEAKTGSGKVIPRVRFVNYYTASTGRIKLQPPPESNQKVLVAETEMKETGLSPHEHGALSSQSSTPRISLSEHREDDVVEKQMDDLNLDEHDYDSDVGEMHQLEPDAEPPSPDLGPSLSHEEPVVPPIDTTSIANELETDSITSPNDDASIATSHITEANLPPLPNAPSPPAPLDKTAYKDPAALKLAQNEHNRAKKAYERAKKDYDKTIREREKYLAKLEKVRKKQEEKDNSTLSPHERSERERIKKEEERMQKEQARLEGREQKEEVKRAATLNQDQYDVALARQRAEDAEKSDGAWAEEIQKKRPKPPKKQKDRKFCTLPKKDEKTGERDPTWIRVFMENMDEVVAHTSLFFVSDTYAKLVGDTADRIEEWIKEDATIRAVKEAQRWENE